MINEITGNSNIPKIYAPSGIKLQTDNTYSSTLNNFDLEDKAIISAQAKMLNEMDKYNAGTGNEIDLAVSQILGKSQVEACANVINTKKEMFNSILKLGKE